MSRTSFDYNGVSLPLVKTEKFSQEPVYSPDGVDIIYTKITIGIGCALNPCMLGNIPVATWLEQNRGKLMARGGQLNYMQEGAWILHTDLTTMPAGHELCSSPSFSNVGGTYLQKWSMDAKLGPKPIRFEVKQVQGDTFLAYYEIETYLPYCYTHGNDPEVGYYLSNRWSTDITLDDMYFVTRVISGVLVLNGQWLQTENSAAIPATAPLLIAHMLSNNIIIPPLPKRWKREGIKINRSSDGLTINYQITDKEQYTSIPRPATKIDAQYTETTGGDGKNIASMCMINCECNVTVYGQASSRHDPTGTAGDATTYKNDINKYELMKIMFQVVFSRIPFLFLLNGPKNLNTGRTIVTYFQLKEDMFKPIVGCVIRVLRVRTQTQINLCLTSNDITPSVFNWTMVGSTIPLGDILSDIATQPTNISNLGMLLLTANVLDGQGDTGKNPVGYFTPAELASALLTPCYNESHRSLASTLVSSTTPQYAGNFQNWTTPVYTSTVNSAGSTWSDPVNTFVSAASVANPFTDYTLDVQYLTDKHIIQLPIMYEPAVGERSCVFAKWAAPTTRKVVHWKASRLNHWPVAPKPSDMTTGLGTTPTSDELLTYDITFADTDMQADNRSRRYEMGGVYTCGLASVIQWDQPGTIPTCVNPITTDVWGDEYSTYPTSLFVSGIIGYGVAPGPGAIV